MESLTTLEHPALDGKSVVEELLKGQKSTAQLRILLRESLPGDMEATRTLVEEIFGSFSRAISALDSSEDQFLCVDEGRSGNSGQKRKDNPVVGKRRGGYRKRKLTSWRQVISKTIGDSFSWRKYGQKEIQNANHPRSYFRCTHKHDQGCQATKQIQKSEDDPSLFIVNYIGEHTCIDLSIGAPHGIPSSPREPSLISFGSNTSNITQEATRPSSSSPSQRQEYDEVLSNLTLDRSSSEFVILSDLYEVPMLANVRTSSGCGDVASAFKPCTGSWETSFMVDSFDFGDNLFSFSQNEFFQGQ